MADETRQRSLRITGLVQGVGFRPSVWHVANRLGLSGNVRNDGRGVLINCICDTDTLQLFIQLLCDESPPLARIDRIEEITDSDSGDLGGMLVNEHGDAHFEIIASSDTVISTGVIADAATCAACLSEMNDATDRRHRYPFLNCTHCGPRFSIIRQIPYDRANTSMQPFMLCEKCENEYLDPADRRFHAQPTACAACGPQLWLCDKDGSVIPCDDAINEAARRIVEGGIVAIKGIGGFQLACDAGNDEAITRLRQRKQRPDKPLALMATDISQIQQHCHVDDAEQTALASPATPIVILDALETTTLPDNIAPSSTHVRQKQLGFMLPNSPLHHLLLQAIEQHSHEYQAGLNPIVLTSGNRSEEPQCIDNDEAVSQLNGIADYFLMHDRSVTNRIDDSVVRVMHGKPRLLRRARGYAPGHINLPDGFRQHLAVLALGGELKNTFCLLKDNQAILSQHMGDLEDARTYADFQKNISLYLSLYAHQPAILAADRHPEYLSTKLAHAWAEKQDLPLQLCQHHHAHIAACMVENQLDIDATPVIGIAFDGLGFGEDGVLWGGEFLLADYCNYQRLAHLKPVAMPGGAQAMREPWRNCWAQLNAGIGWQAFSEVFSGLDLFETLNDKPVSTLQQMLDRGINSPLSSSAGRLFDAVAAATGAAPDRCSFEGQAAMLLETCIDVPGTEEVVAYAFDVNRPLSDEPTECLELDPTPMWRSLLQDIETGVATSLIAARFHQGLADCVVATACQLAHEHGIQHVALSGGVFQNRHLFEQVVEGLEQNRLQALTHQQVPANDGGLALGQAVIAAARSIKHQQTDS